MSKLNITLVIISTLLAVCFGNDKFQVQRDEEIEDVDGYEAYAGQYPWYALINTDLNVCGGSIISSRWIMTEAYCVDGATEFHVYFGKTNYSDNLDPSEAILSKRAITHPLFNNPTRLANNIGLIQLPTDIELGSLTVRAITLPWDIIDDLTLIKTNFVGFIYVDVDAVFQKRWNHLQVITDEECSNMTSIDGTVLCTLGTSFNELQTPCYAHDGSALAYYLNGTWTQIGIGSVRSRCQTDIPAKFTRITLFLEWIAAITGISA